MLVNTFVMSNLYFYSTQFLNETETLQKTVLHFLLNDYDNDYKDLLFKSDYPNINLRRTKALCIEIYKT